MLNGEARSGSGLSTDSPLSIWLDTFRWIAATGVLFTHTNFMLFVNEQKEIWYQRPYLLRMIAAISAWGRPAVIVFFVLSGFLVAGAVLRQIRLKGSFSSAEYLISRLTRLWLVLIPAYGLIAVFNWAGIRMLDGITTGAYPEHLEPGWTQLKYAICNAAFLQTAVCPNFGGSDPLWSLFNEFWYYMYWLVLSLVLTRPWPVKTRLAIFALGSIVFLALAHAQYRGLGTLRDNLALYFLLWLFGAAAATETSLRWRIPVIPATVALLAALIFVRALTPPSVVLPPLAEFTLDAMVAISFAALIVAMRQSKGLKIPPFPIVHKSLAAFSFSLYVLHEPIIRLVIAITKYVGFSYASNQINQMVTFIATIGLCYLVSWAFATQTEARTLDIRRSVLRHWRTTAAIASPTELSNR